MKTGLPGQGIILNFAFGQCFNENTVHGAVD
jgi:hypothetical protein